MPVIYKRKFQVPGDTIKNCWNFRKKCDRKYGYVPNKKPCMVEQPPPRRTYLPRMRREESRCPFPINQPSKYIVSEMDDGTWRCSCPVWKFRRQQCHHIGKAQRNPEEYEIAKEHTQRTTETLRKIFEGA